MAQKFGGTAAADYRPLFGISYVRALAGVMATGIVFTMTDFFTSFVALNEGFGEGNSLLLSLSSALGISVIDSLLLSKAVFIAGLSVLAVVGIKVQDKSTKRLMLGCAAIFMVIFGLVSLNNLYWIAG